VAWQHLIEANIKKLQHVAAIASARVILERERRGKGLFRLFAILEVPGPDFHAEAADYTVQAALRKVVHNLRRQIQFAQRPAVGPEEKSRAGKRPEPGALGDRSDEERRPPGLRLSDTTSASAVGGPACRSRAGRPSAAAR